MLDFSLIFVRYSSKVFDDFRGFQRFCMFSHVRLNASMRQLVSNGVHFSWNFTSIRSILSSKFQKFHIDFVYNLAVKTKRDDVFLYVF